MESWNHIKFPSQMSISTIFIIFRPWQQRDVTPSDHVICVIKLELVFPFQMDCYVLFVRKPFLTHAALKSVFYPTLESHVSVEVIVPVVAFTTLLALE